MSEKVLNSLNIGQEIERYLSDLQKIPLEIKANSFTEFYKILKRESFNRGPYPNVSLFEGMNRIMSDLVILFGIKILLDPQTFKEHNFPYTEYTAQLSVSSEKAFDIMASEGKRRLVGEAFNVAPTFFNGKKSRELKKLSKFEDKEADFLLIYNVEAANSSDTFELINNVLHLRVKLPDL
ncbi:hypothetical protein EHO58_05530 [Leptospira selangorensis]|uniref:hypothetical protein n=1 Tax=Leptospira selangorensis TaxID=2484982 RepID=UPI00108482EF|nr:hypothetical protein [Leptospira selangorensis]TGK08636.1 hypothetical protein EHO58_05530 [Leptospira selangorensis]